MEKLKIAIVDDQLIFRQAMKTRLSKLADIDIVLEATNGITFLNELEKSKPDVVFIDIEMPEMNGVEATKIAIEKYPDLVIIGLSMYDNQNFINDLINAGAKGYLLKLSNNTQLLKTILKCPKNDMFFSSEIIEKQKNSEINQKTILVIDDFEPNTFIISFTLENAGYKVSKTQSVEDAIRLLTDNHIDLVITNYNVKEISGQRLVNLLRSVPFSGKEVLPILFTGVKEAESEEIPYSKWIEKPIQRNQFIKTISSFFVNDGNSGELF